MLRLKALGIKLSFLIFILNTLILILRATVFVVLNTKHILLKFATYFYFAIVYYRVKTGSSPRPICQLTHKLVNTIIRYIINLFSKMFRISSMFISVVKIHHLVNKSTASSKYKHFDTTRREDLCKSIYPTALLRHRYINEIEC